MNVFWEMLFPSPMCCIIIIFCPIWVLFMFLYLIYLVIKAQPNNCGNRVSIQMYSGITNYCEICRKNLYVWRTDKLELSLSCANSYDQNQNQLLSKNLYYNQSQKNYIAYAKYMWKIYVYIGMHYLYIPFILQIHIVIRSRNMQVHQDIYI